MAEYFFSEEEIRAQVLAFMRQRDIYPIPRDAHLILDGQIHRYHVEGDRGHKKNGAYRIHTDGHPAGWVQDWKSPDGTVKWGMNTDGLSSEKLSDVEKSEKSEKTRIEREKREAEKKKYQAERSQAARELWDSCTEGEFKHAYLTKKGIKSHGTRLRVTPPLIIVPLQDENGTIVSVQTIDNNGEKINFKGAPKNNTFFPIDFEKIETDKKTPILIAEGFATAAKINELTGCPIAVAVDSGNLINVAAILSRKYKGRKLIIMADNDLATEHSKGWNPGILKANETKAQNPAVVDVLYPQFGVDDLGSDWDDYALVFGENSPGIKDMIEKIHYHTLTALEQEEYKNKKELLELIGLLDPKKELPPQEFIGGIFPRGFVSAIVAPPGTGKTIFMQKGVSDLSIGGTFFDGVAENEPPRTSLIFAAEAGYDLLLRRAASFNWNITPERVKVVDQYKYEVAGKTVMLDDEKEGWHNVLVLIDEVKPDIIFFDTLSSFHTKDENKATDMKPIIQNLSKLAKEKNIAIVLNHHSRKRTSKERTLSLSQDDVIGSSIFNRLVGLIIGIEPMKENEKVLLVRPLKTWFSAFMPFTYQITEDFYGHAVVETDLSPEGINNSRLSVWNYLRATFQVGEWFNISQIVLSEIEGNVTARQLRTILPTLVKTNKLKKQGSTKNVEYSIVGIQGQ